MAEIIDIRTREAYIPEEDVESGFDTIQTVRDEEGFIHMIVVGKEEENMCIECDDFHELSGIIDYAIINNDLILGV